MRAPRGTPSSSIFGKRLPSSVTRGVRTATQPAWFSLTTTLWRRSCGAFSMDRALDNPSAAQLSFFFFFKYIFKNFNTGLYLVLLWVKAAVTATHINTDDTKILVQPLNRKRCLSLWRLVGAPSLLWGSPRVLVLEGTVRAGKQLASHPRRHWRREGQRDRENLRRYQITGSQKRRAWWGQGDDFRLPTVF